MDRRLPARSVARYGDLRPWRGYREREPARADRRGDGRGLATYRRLDRDAELVTLDADPTGVGTGTALIEALVARLRADGCERLWLTTTNDKLSALRFYLRRDFRLIQVRLGAVDDCGCGEATISIGLSEAVPTGRVVGVDLDKHALVTARRYAASTGRGNLALAVADGRRLPFGAAAFDAVFCHSMLETLGDPTSVVAELRRVTKRGGVVGAASVEYGGIILAGRQTAGPQRFYDIRQQIWRAAGIAEPNMGRHLRGLFQEAEFGRVEAFADYISYGTPDRVMAFARDRAIECRDRELRTSAARHGIASGEELTELAAQWEEWGAEPGAFFAFPWSRVLAWP